MVSSSRHSRRWLYTFGAVLLLLVIGLALTVWPRYRLVIQPKLDQYTVTVPIKIDTGVTEVIVGSNVVPGTLVARGSSAPAGWRLLTLPPSGQVLVNEAQVESLVRQALQQAAGPSELLLAESFSTLWAAPKTISASVMSVRVSATGTFRRDFKLSDWLPHLLGQNSGDALKWLKKQPGIQGAFIQGYPSFLAKVKQKLPGDPRRVRFILDINGKTSILE